MTCHAIEVNHPDLGALFDENGPHAPMAFAVLGGRSPGRAFADDSHDPTLAIVQTHEGLAIASGGAPRGFMDAAVERLRADSMVGLVWFPADGPEPQEVPSKRVERVDFTPLDPSAESLARYKSLLPPAVRAAPITRDLLERCEWRDVVAA